MTDTELFSRIRRLYRARRPLNISAVKRSHPELIESAYSRRPFLGWRQALEQAGVDYAKIAVELQNHVECPLCGKSFQSLGIHLKFMHGLTSGEFAREFPDLPISGEVHRQIRRPAPAALPHWETVWTREYLLDRIWQWYLLEGRCNPKRITVLDPNMMGMLFSYRLRSTTKGETWNETLLALGLDPGQERLLAPRNKYSDPETVIAAIRKLRLDGEPLIMSHIGLHHATLYKSAKKHFGGWRGAMKAAGLGGYRYTRLRGVLPTGPVVHPTLKSWISAVRGHHAKGGSLDSTELLAADPELVRSLYRHFPRWDDGMNAARLLAVASASQKPTRHQGSVYGKPHLVLDRLRSLHEEGEPMTATVIARNHPGLMRSLTRIFGKWPVARDMAGITLEMLPDSVLGKYMNGIFRPKGQSQTRPEALAAIRARHESGGSLLGCRVAKQNRPLYKDAIHFFGTWGRAIKEAGLVEEHSRQVGNVRHPPKE